MVRCTIIESCAQHLKPKDTHFVRIPTQKCCCIFIVKGRLCWIGLMACLLSLFGTAKSGVYFSPATGSASSRFTTHIIMAGSTLLPKKKHYLPPVCPFNLTMTP